MQRSFLLAGAALLLAGCSVPRPQLASLPPLPALAAQQASPRLALLEHVLAAYFASDIASRPTVCAAVHDGRSDEALPPEDEVALIERFARLAPLSRCAEVGGAWRDAETEQPALVFTLHSFTCASAASCTGWAGYRAGAAASRSSLYRMEWGGERWAVTRDDRAIAQ
jgi:Prokaryotic membrane lipoprotein lipid attachment site